MEGGVGHMALLFIDMGVLQSRRPEVLEDQVVGVGVDGVDWLLETTHPTHSYTHPQAHQPLTK